MGEVSLQKSFPYSTRMCRCAPFLGRAAVLAPISGFFRLSVCLSVCLSVRLSLLASREAGSVTTVTKTVWSTSDTTR